MAFRDRRLFGTFKKRAAVALEKGGPYFREGGGG